MSERARAQRIRVDAWLSAGGVVLAANERAARSTTAAFHAARRADGLTAWLTPAIFTWDSWVRELWLGRNSAGRMPLNTLQEQALWLRVIRGRGQNLLHPHRLAAAAQRAHALLCDHAPAALTDAARLGWGGDAATFGEWLGQFNALCRRERLVSSNRLSRDLAENLQSRVETANEVARSALLLVGFDRLPVTQRAVLEKWGEWKLDAGEGAPHALPGSAYFYRAEEDAAELAACVRWLRLRLETKPEARLMVIVPGLRERRGELERALLDSRETAGAGLDFEFSLGVALGQVGLVRCAVLLLRWLHEPLSEAEIDWLIGCGHAVASAEEEFALAGAMRWLRDKGGERPEWGLEEFADCVTQAGQGAGGAGAWASRWKDELERLKEAAGRRSPLEWVRVAGELLQAAGWPGFRPLTSEGFQARLRWEKVLEDCGSLGFDGSQPDWAGFVGSVSTAVSEAIFAVESTDARIQILEPLVSAGQMADGIWFLGADDESWPGRGQPNPLLPIGLQREAGMPHSSSGSDWDAARETTTRLLGSADEVIFSYARRGNDSERRPSRLMAKRVGPPQEMPAEWTMASGGVRNEPLTEMFADWSQIPYRATAIQGGARTLTRQSHCPFQAFAAVRLSAEDWEPAEAGLNAKERGALLHGVLHRVWGRSAGGGISSLRELEQIPDLQAFVAGFVRAEMAEFEGGGSRDEHRRPGRRRFPERYLALEAKRLVRLVTEWLRFELGRWPFRVVAIEEDRVVSIGGVSLGLRIDRIDAVEDGSQLILDYKSGSVGPKAWTGDRPDDVQLPLYATYAMEGALAGLVFARVRPGEVEFRGRVRDAATTLLPSLSKSSGLMKNPLTNEQLEDWRRTIEELGADFLTGRADVDPKDRVKTCETCHLHSVCRIYENEPLAVADDEDSDGNSSLDGEAGEDA